MDNKRVNKNLDGGGDYVENNESIVFFQALRVFGYEMIKRVFFSIAVIALLAGMAGASTLTVDDSGGAMFIKIQDAIVKASQGDTILVNAGSYYEDVNVYKNNLTILGSGRNETTIYGTWSMDPVVDIKAKNVYFGGFNITRRLNSPDMYSGVASEPYVRISGISNTLENIRVDGSIIAQSPDDFTPFDNKAIINNNEANMIFIDKSNKNIVQGNTAQEFHLQLSDENHINSNTVMTFYMFLANRSIFNNNTIQLLSMGQSYKNTFEYNKIQTFSNEDGSSNNTIHGNTLLTLSIKDSTDNTIYGNTLSAESGDDPGIHIVSSGGNIISANTILSDSWKFAGISLIDSSNNSINSNNITGGRYGILIKSGSNHNSISNNVIQRSHRSGIFISRSGGNGIYGNTFNSAGNANDYSGFNSWEGNYWSDYKGRDVNGDGVGDSPYNKIITNSESVDKRPLMSRPCNCSLLDISQPAPVNPSGSTDLLFPDSGDDLTCVWTPLNFEGFDNDGIKNESLRVNMNGFFEGSVNANNLVYLSEVEKKDFAARSFGDYDAIGFMGDKYIAGYTSGSKNITATPVSVIKNGRLHMILIDDGAYRALNRSSLMIEEGYALEVRDAKGKRARVSLSKDGVEVDTREVADGDIYVYGRPLPIIAAGPFSIDNDSVSIKGIFQISGNSIPVSIGTTYGIMEITGVSEKGISMATSKPLHFARGDAVAIMGNLKLKASDSDIFRFYLYNGSSGGAGCWFDLDAGYYSQTYEITNISGRTIPEGQLRYTTVGFESPYIITKITGRKPVGTDGSYTTVWIGEDKYAAVDGNTGRLAKVLVEDGGSNFEKRTLVYGDIMDMGDGYRLEVRDIDTRSYLRGARLVLSRNGAVLEDKNVSQGEEYTVVGKNLSRENDVPVFVTYLDAVFSGTTTDMIQLRYTWLMSGDVIELKEGDEFGILRVTKAKPELIEFKNEKAVELNPGSSVELFRNLSFSVANSSEVRFYPVSMGTQVMPEEVTDNAVLETPEETNPVGASTVAGRTERAAGFEVVISIMIILAVYITGRKIR
ncbi:MAG: S-layer protein domain-containing protein [Candidatus Methanoperedens sp.]